MSLNRNTTVCGHMLKYVNEMLCRKVASMTAVNEWPRLHAWESDTPLFHALSSERITAHRWFCTYTSTLSNLLSCKVIFGYSRVKFVVHYFVGGRLSSEVRLQPRKFRRSAAGDVHKCWRIRALCCVDVHAVHGNLIAIAGAILQSS